MPEEALKLFTVHGPYRYFTDQAKLLRSQSRSRIEYLMPTDNVTVFD